MRATFSVVLAGAAALAVAACNNAGNSSANAANESDTVGATGTSENASATTGGSASGATASASFPKGARIVEENGVTYRVDPNGTRVELGPNDSRIVVENGVSYRVDPGGTRVRLDPTGAAIDVDVPNVDVKAPKVNVGINEKGHPDVDVTPPAVTSNTGR